VFTVPGLRLPHQGTQPLAGSECTHANPHPFTRPYLDQVEAGWLVAGFDPLSLSQWETCAAYTGSIYRGSQGALCSAVCTASLPSCRLCGGRDSIVVALCRADLHTNACTASLPRTTYMQSGLPGLLSLFAFVFRIFVFFCVFTLSRLCCGCEPMG